LADALMAELRDIPSGGAELREEAAAHASGACPVCGGSWRRWFERDGRHYVRCRSCRLASVAEGLVRDHAGKSIYEVDNSIFLERGADGYYLDPTNLLNSARKLAWVARDLPAPARLLDAGSNFGHFLKVAGDRYDARGFDRNPMVVEWGRTNFGVRATVASILDPPDEPEGFDAVTCWDVIEHLPDPVEALRALRSRLKPEGRLFLSTPDTGSLAARLLGRRWHYLDAVQHINLFSRANLERALDQAGFSVVRVGAMGHDYRLRYVFDRLAYIHPHGVLRAAVGAGRWVLQPLLGASVYLNLRDVLVLTAVRKD
jgi:SAM-dependent methyltransferase